MLRYTPQLRQLFSLSIVCVPDAVETYEPAATRSALQGHFRGVRKYSENICREDLAPHRRGTGPSQRWAESRGASVRYVLHTRQCSVNHSFWKRYCCVTRSSWPNTWSGAVSTIWPPQNGHCDIGKAALMSSKRLLNAMASRRSCAACWSAASALSIPCGDGFAQDLDGVTIGHCSLFLASHRTSSLA
jgi:hypothetical protein